MRPGQFFVLGFDGTNVPDLLTDIEGKFGLGGTVLFERNIESPEQLKSLTGELRKFSPLIAIDQEGGPVQRLRPPHFSNYPPPCEMTLDSAFEHGKNIGDELKRLGINLNFAPVLDVDTNPKNPVIGRRSFGSDPNHVAEMGRLFVNGLHEASVFSCGKHFPGHGGTDQDSHLILPVIEKSREELERCELYPFKKLIQETYEPTNPRTQTLECLMTAHIVYTALDTRYPATFSSRILNGLLRGDLGFRGIVITDDMCMAGALTHADLPDACIEAFAAGCDLLLVCKERQRHEETIAALGEAMRRSDALQKRGEESLARIRSTLDL